MITSSSTQNKMHPSNKYLLAIGETLIDAITNNFVTDLSQATTLSIHPGGSPANLCRFVQACGGQAKLVAAVGKDGLGKILLRSLEASGLSTQYIQELADHATSMIVVGRSTGTPDFIPYRNADRFLQPVEDSLIYGASVVHTTAFALSKAPAQANILQAFTQAKDKGIAVSVDWNYALPIWGEANNALKVFNELLALHPLLKVSMDDVERFTGKVLSIEDAKSYLQSLQANIICLTCGAKGVWYKKQHSSWEHMEAQQVTIVDTTGAGDAFWAGFLTSWMQGVALEKCVRQGITTAARRLEGKL